MWKRVKDLLRAINKFLFDNAHILTFIGVMLTIYYGYPV